MRIIGITGGLGFLGSNIIPKLIKKFNTKIRILDNMTNACNYIDNSNHVEIIQGDIRNSADVNNFVDGCNTIIHLAAHTRVIDSIEDPKLNIDININGSFNIIEAVRKFKVESIINASTGGAILGEVTPPINEEIAGKPASPYGASKASVEALCWAYQQSYGIHAASLRFSNVYGPKCQKKESVVAKFFKDIIQKGSVTVYGDGNQTRDFLYVDDLSDGLIKTLDKKKSGVFQLASSIPLSINNLIEMMRPIVKKKFDVTYMPSRSGEIEHTYCSIDKAKSDLDWQPQQDIHQGLMKTFEYCKKIY